MRYGRPEVRPRTVGSMTSRCLRGARLCVVLALFVVGLSPAGARAATTPYKATGLTPDQIALAEWAIHLFREAGLGLPPIDFVGHDTTESCFGRSGAQTFHGGTSTIH